MMRIVFPQILRLVDYVHLHDNETTCCEYQLYAEGPRLKAPGVEVFSGEGRYERSCWCEDESYGPYGGDKECGGPYAFHEFLDTRVWFFEYGVGIRDRDDYYETDAIYGYCEEG